MKIYDSLRSQPLRRTPDNIVAGVCAGLAHRWGISPVLVRVGALVLIPIGGIGLLLYGLGWLLIPSYDDADILLEGALHDPDASVAAASVLTIAGIAVFLPFITASAGITFRRAPFFGLVILVAVAYVLGRFRSPRSSDARRFDDAQGTHDASDFDSARGSLPDGVTPTQPVGVTESLGVAHPIDATQPIGTTQPLGVTESIGVTEPIDVAGADGVGGARQARKTKPRRVRTPAASGRFIRMFLALAIVAGAISLLATRGSLASILMALAVPLGVVALGVMIAGARGLRGSWLTATTWLLAIPTTIALIVALFIPNHILLAPNTTLLTTSTSAKAPTLLYTAPGNVIRSIDNISPAGRHVKTFIVASQSYLVNEEVPVIFEFTRHPDAYGDSHVRLSGTSTWEASLDGQKVTSWYPGQRSSQDEQRYEATVSLDPGQSLTFASPAAIANASAARHIKIMFSYGSLDVDGVSPSFFDPPVAEEYSEKPGADPDAAPESTGAEPGTGVESQSASTTTEEGKQ
ncbi:PspC domain-containing protein [Trueperella pecoris]|uniref:PspC domain-containing protein n=1 Tax=Trueperella pecoris TaxID=2733571 RepID=UPI001ABEBDE0|nr:PspC domain-containing protein [Trueperella pecoris]QTG76302.1 PspC domain-containing protein [Trueperella pecoris]